MENNFVNLHYMEFNLGSLSYKSNFYFWLPNISEISKAEKKYSLKMKFFFLPKKSKEIYEEVPEHFSSFLKSCDREDLFECADIKDTDNDFIKLKKLANLDFKPGEFIIKNF